MKTRYIKPYIELISVNTETSLNAGSPEIQGEQVNVNGNSIYNNDITINQSGDNDGFDFAKRPGLWDDEW